MRAIGGSVAPSAPTHQSAAGRSEDEIKQTLGIFCGFATVTLAVALSNPGAIRQTHFRPPSEPLCPLYSLYSLDRARNIAYIQWHFADASLPRWLHSDARVPSAPCWHGDACPLTNADRQR